MIRISRKCLADVALYVPPENQGQIVETAFGWCEDGLLRRVVDTSDGTEDWSFAAHEAVQDEHGLWNAVPVVEDSAWRSVEWR